METNEMEQAEVDFIIPHIEPDDVVLEIGAGHGTVTVPLSKKAKKVVAYEMDARNFVLLKENVRQSGAKNVQMVRRGVLARGGIRPYWVRSEWWNTSRVVGPVYGDMGNLRFACFDAIGKLMTHHRPTVIVMDVEGDEFFISQKLVGTDLRALLMEVHLRHLGSRADEMRTHLLKSGFRLAQVAEKTSTDVVLEYWKGKR